jgi:hypothetical protein
MLLCAIGWTSLALGAVSFILFAVAMFLDRKSGASGPQVKGADIPNLAEALAKLVEAFAKAGPTISALVASLIFVGFSAWVALRPHPCGCGPEHTPVQNSSMPLTTMCVVHGLPEPSTLDQAPVLSADVLAIFDNAETQEPKGCVKSTLERAITNSPDLIFLIGQADRRQLRPRARQVYGDNFAVAYQRSALLKAYLVDRFRGSTARPSAALSPQAFASRIVTLSAGPVHVGRNLDKAVLAEDRSVELVAYWNSN